VAANHSENVRGLILLNSAGPFSDTESNRQPNLAQKLLRSILPEPLASYLLFLYTRQPKTIRKTLEKVYLDRSAITEQLIEEYPSSFPGCGSSQSFCFCV
jgi:pimeloyl-ACP methyl ester carboxylesterase